MGRGEEERRDWQFLFNHTGEGSQRRGAFTALRDQAPHQALSVLWGHTALVEPASPSPATRATTALKATVACHLPAQVRALSRGVKPGKRATTPGPVNIY